MISITVVPYHTPRVGTFGVYMEYDPPLLPSSRSPQRAVTFGGVCGAFFSCLLASACSPPPSVDIGHVSGSTVAQGH